MMVRATLHLRNDVCRVSFAVVYQNYTVTYLNWIQRKLRFTSKEVLVLIIEVKADPSGKYALNLFSCQK